MLIAWGFCFKYYAVAQSNFIIALRRLHDNHIALRLFYHVLLPKPGNGKRGNEIGEWNDFFYHTKSRAEHSFAPAKGVIENDGGDGRPNNIESFADNWQSQKRNAANSIHR